MVSKLFGILGDSNEKQIKRLQWVVDETNALEGEFEALSDEALRSTVVELREQLDEDETLDDLLPKPLRRSARRHAALSASGTSTCSSLAAPFSTRGR